MAIELNESGDAVTLNSVTVRTPGLGGQMEVREPVTARAGRRAEGDIHPALADALQNARMTEQLTVELTITTEVSFPEGARRGPKDEEAIEVTVPGPGKDYRQVMIATDEAGVISWHFPLDESNNIDTRGGSEQTFMIPRRVAQVPPTATSMRGSLGTLGMKILKLVAFPLLDPVIGSIGKGFVASWEKRNRQYALRTFTPGNYTRLVGEEVTTDALRNFAGGRSLLFVHGTFSRASSAFGDLDPGTMQSLYEKYEQRVIALDHPTLSASPAENVDWFLKQVPDDASLDFDIICHSRGGLVTRELAARTGSRVNVNRVVFVAAPNAGTILTSSRHMGDFIDAYTNVLMLFPDNAVTDTIEAVIAVVKQIAVDVLAALPGLQAMLPGGTVIKALDAALPSERHYFALASNFEPRSEDKLPIRAADAVLDQIFQHAGNDLVVPTAGVYQFGPHQDGFGENPAPRLRVFDGPGAPVHTQFFKEPKTRESILSWLTA